MKDRESVLKHRTRKMIISYVRNHPGVPFGELKETLDLSDGTLRYHLGYLEKSREIESRFKGGKKIFFPSDLSGSEHPGIRDANLSRDQKRIVSIIKRDPGITARDIHSMINIRKKLLKKDLRRLEGQGLIRRGKDGGFHYASRHRIKQEVFKLLVIKLIRNEIDEDTFNYLKEELEND